MYSCIQCRSRFNTSDEVLKHCSSDPNHPFCDECNLIFPDNTALWRHIRSHQDVQYPQQYTVMDTLAIPLDAANDASASVRGDIACEWCHTSLSSTEKLHKHRQQVHHWCVACDRYFSKAQALANHLSSPVHKKKSHMCPICKKAHKIPSATAHHLESGVHGNTRHHVTAVAQSLNIIPSILSSRRLQGASISRPTITYYKADESTFNGSRYQCFLCKRSFRKLDGLNSHLNSAAHDQDEFKCPHSKCQREFTVISALIQHIESGKCGIARLDQVERIANDLAARFLGALAF